MPLGIGLQSVAIHLCSLFVLSIGMAPCSAYRHVYLWSSQVQASSNMFQAEGQCVCWTSDVPAVLCSPEGTVHLVNMACTTASTGLTDAWRPARQPVCCPQERKTAGQGKLHSLCLCDPNSYQKCLHMLKSILEIYVAWLLSKVYFDVL